LKQLNRWWNQGVAAIGVQDELAVENATAPMWEKILVITVLLRD
jgi:hypothetical protein